jgi:hypothetical protein
VPETGKTSYVLPLRWTGPGPADELAAYLAGLAGLVDEVIVVDGSPVEVFEANARAFGESVRHIRPDPALRFANGKVNGVATGVRECRNEYVVIADDDVRYEAAELERVAGMLDRADLVRPQNYFWPWVWHALWDAPRSLLNRVWTGDHEFPRGDFPGTLAIRRSTFVGAGGYDGDTLFENLELMRTVLAAGGRILSPLDLYVARIPPSGRHFLSQRVRQAYDDRAMPVRALVFLGILPSALLLPGRARRFFLGTVALGSVAAAERGRRTAGGERYFPARTSLFAPAWVFERALCSWLALGSALRGGAKYGEGRLGRSANPTNRLRRRLALEERDEPPREVVSPPASRR